MSKASFKLDTDGWYRVTKGKIYFCDNCEDHIFLDFCVLLFPLSTEPLLVYLISDSGFSTKLRG